MQGKAKPETVYSPGPRERTVCSPDGLVETVPEGWELLPPGDAGLTRRVKAAGPHFVVKERKGRRMFSRGVWAEARVIEQLRSELEAERATPAYAKRQAAAAKRRDKQQAEYVEDFNAAIVEFLDFAPTHAEIAQKLAIVVTAHATPVGSGTVARTKRIPVEKRAAAAVIAWMRHQTTGYDSMKIERKRGRRREVRRILAGRSRELLERYRSGESIPEDCPLRLALAKVD